MGWHDHIGNSAEGNSTKRGCLFVAIVILSCLSCEAIHLVKAIHLGQLPSQNLQNLATDRQPCSVNRTNPQCLDNSCPYRFRHSSVPLQSASKRLLEATFTFCVSCHGLRGHRGHRGDARRARRSWRGRVRRGRPCAPCTSPARPRPQASRRRHLKVKFGFLSWRSKSIDISHEENWDRMH